jgi:hypothetical protein
MKAKIILRRKWTDRFRNLEELVVWEVPEDHRHPEGVRYRLAYIPEGWTIPAVLYDNHHPKGHHKHLEGLELPYTFASIPKLISDFEADCDIWLFKRGLS